jgi:hypothetical protein
LKFFADGLPEKKLQLSGISMLLILLSRGDVTYFIEYHNVNAPTMQYHMDEDIPCSDLQIFQWMGMTVDASTAYQPTEEELVFALLYMYANMDEMDQYFT